jgi:Tfp pilus assembly protein PilX
VEEAESRLLQISQDHASKLAALQTAQQELRAVEHFANNECSRCHAAFASARNEPCGHRLMCVPCNGEYRITNGDNREEYVHYMFIRDRQTDCRRQTTDGRLQTADGRRQTADGRRDL